MSVKLLTKLQQKLVWSAVVLAAVAVFLSWHIFKQKQAFSQRTHCVGNLVHISLAKHACQEEMGLTNGAPILNKALEKFLEETGSASLSAYKCPNGGTYRIGNVGTPPECTYTSICYTWDLQKNPPWLHRRAWKHSLNP